MIQRAEQLIALYERFTDNYTKFSEYNDALLIDCGAEEWQILLNKRSEAQRDILNENEEILKQARELMNTPIVSKEEADEILIYYRRLLNTRLSDYYLLDIIYKPLLDFYEKTGDALRLIGLNVSAGAVVLETFDRLDVSMSPIDGKKCCERAIAYGRMVSPKQQPDVWMSVFSAYANMIGSVNAYYPENRKNFFRYYDEALAYFEDPEIGPILEAQPNGPMFKSVVVGRILYAMNCYEVMSEEDRERFRTIIREQIRDLLPDYSPGETSVLKYFLSYQIGDTKPRKAFQSLLSDYFRLDQAKYETKDIVIKTDVFLERSYILSSLLELLKDEAFDEEERNTYGQEITAKIMELVHSVPYSYMTNYINTSCASLCTAILSILKKPEQIQNVVIALLILRQPITYIHSLMVKEISVTIAKEMVRQRPELFIPLYGNTVEEIAEREEEILKFVANAALLHDIGKSKVANFINNQYRRITDLEFNYIKFHTQYGPDVMMHMDGFEPYYDIMLGHHKTYDGKGGYPAEFDNTASPYRIMIDLITIADCTDAATDILGRNYARGKDFFELLAELSAAKGTRYNPEIVTLMEESRELCKQLEYLTGNGRHEIYYKAYRDIMNINSSD